MHLSHEKIRRLQVTVRHKVNALFAGNYRSIFKGRGIEFEELREYFPGDDIRAIDWNVTARYQRPFIKNFREERELTLMLIVDISASSEFGNEKQSKKELMAEIGALLAFAAIKNQDKVGLILFTNKVELYLKPAKGIKHVLRVIRELLYFVPQQKGTNVACALAFLSAVQKKKTVTFLMSDFFASGFEKEASLASKRHELNVFHILNKREECFYPYGLLTLQDLETGETRVVDTAHMIVRETFAKTSKDKKEEVKILFSKLNTSYLTIDNEEKAEEALYRFFRLKKKK